MKEKRAFVANIFDLKLTRNYREVDKHTGEEISKFNPLDKNSKKPETKKLFYSVNKEFSNERWAIYCSCGHRNEYSYSCLKHKNSFDTLIAPVACGGCGKIYESLDNIQVIHHSKKAILNVVSKRFGVVEKDNFFALYSFATTVFVSATTKNLIFRDFGNHSIYLSKKGRILRSRNGEKIVTVPLKRLVKYCNSTINHFMLNAFKESIIPEALFQIKVINPLIKFCNIVESRCDKRDVEKILNLLDKEREDIYYKSLFNYAGNEGDHHYLFFYQDNFNYDILHSHYLSKTISTSRYIWIQYLKKRLCIMLAMYLYPPLATIIINYGPNAMLTLLNDTSLMCTLTDLIRRKPTNPKNIFEVMFKARVSAENHKSKKIIKYTKEQVAKQKRQLKKENPKATGNLFPATIVQHPTLIVDSRIPISDDFKLKLKSIHFKKYYVDLFLYNFDKTACIFYGIINGSSVFENFETFNECVEKHTKEEVIEMANFFQVNYDTRRIESNAKLNYKNIQHIFKINKATEKLKLDNPKKNTYSMDRISQTYMDVISMLLNMEMDISDILKCKNSDELNDMHDAISQSYKLSLDKKSSEMLKVNLLNYRPSEGVINGIKFELLDTAEKFYEESKHMNHCVQTYCKQTCDGRYVIYSIEDVDSKERATLSINRMVPLNLEQNLPGTEIDYSFNQLKAKNNQKSSEKIIGAVRELCAKFFNLKNIQSYDLNAVAFGDLPHPNLLRNMDVNVVEVERLPHNDFMDELPF
jgi:hypothetical protein